MVRPRIEVADESAAPFMRGLTHRMQLVLFLAAVFVPGVVLAVLSLRVVSQDRELRGKRQADERRLLVERARNGLLAVLGPLRSDEIREDLAPGQSYRHPETVFVAWSQEGRLVLPWEPERDRAVRDSREPYQAANARWLLAQSEEAAGHTIRALALFRSLLHDETAATDADGVPLALHAARALAQQGQGDAEILRVVHAAVVQRPWVAPLSSFVVKEIADQLARNAGTTAQASAAQDVVRLAAAKVRLLQQAETLQSDFQRIRSVLNSRKQPVWAAFGDDIWLIGAVDGPEGNSTILAVRGQDVFERAAVAGALRLADAREPEGEPLGESFPGLKLILAPVAPAAPDPGAGLQRRLLYAALAAVVAVTMFAAYLLWRDLRREMRLSELRAQFVASVSHELKTPLTAIRMFAETLQMGRCAGPDMQSEYLSTIVNECERLSRLVDGVLMFSKAEQGKKIYRFRPVHPLEAVQAAARAMECPLAQQGFRLRITAEEGLGAIQADHDALEQAILNLLSNAIKFSGDARDIEVGLCREGRDVAIRVTDHGIGIAPEEQTRIFDRFYRAPTRENQSLPGSGLGLTLVAQIARAHGGRIDVESTPGAGSTFYLRLPAGAPAETRQEVKT